jgi:hypothetical protein
MLKLNKSMLNLALKTGNEELRNEGSTPFQSQFVKVCNTLCNNLHFDRA